MAYLNVNGLSFRSIDLYLSALRFAQIALGGQDPQFTQLTRLHYVKQGVRRQQPAHMRPQRLPITPTILRTLFNSWSRTPITYNKVMLWAACCLGYFAFLRSGEFTSSPSSTCTLEPSDIAVDNRSNPTYITVRLRRSKTDQFGRGTTIFVGRTHEDICPVAAVLAYLARRPGTPGPLFIFDNGAPLSRSYLVRTLRTTLTDAGIDTTGYSGHSFRIGAASAAAKAGLPDSMIQTLGRWKSAAFLSYIRIPVDRLVSTSQLMMKPV